MKKFVLSIFLIVALVGTGRAAQQTIIVDPGNSSVTATTWAGWLNAMFTELYTTKLDECTVDGQYVVWNDTTGHFDCYTVPTITWGNGLDFTGGTASVETNALKDALEYRIGNGTDAITTGIKGTLEIPWDATITKATLLCDQTGSIVVDAWVDTYANYPPTVADTITASAPMTISSAIKSQDTTLTGWTTAVSAGSIVRFNVNSASTVTECLISLGVDK